MESKGSVPLCSICLEPVYHPICADCLKNRIEEWLEAEAPFLIPELEKVHDWLENDFKDDREEGKTKCAICGDTANPGICPYCYVREVFHHLRRYFPELADRLSESVIFDQVHVYNFELRK